MSTHKPSVTNVRITPGNDVDVWACGKMFDTGSELVEILNNKGISAGLVDVEVVKPIDISPFNKDCKLIVTLEDNDDNIRILNFGWPDKFIEQGTYDELAYKYGLMPQQIAERICEYIEGKA